MKIQYDLLKKYAELCHPPGNADAEWKKARGYEFEKLLAALLRADGLDPRTSYRPLGEQIDGSLFFDGMVLLLEAKWHTDPMPASALYQFKGKVDGEAGMDNWYFHINVRVFKGRCPSGKDA